MKKHGGAECAVVNCVVRVGPIAMVACDHRPEGAEGISHADIEGEGCSRQSGGQCKSPENPGVLGK